jgi:hypothetical protein
MSSAKLYELLFEIMVAIGGPKTNQHVKAKNKSFNITRIVLYILFKEFNFVPIRFIFEANF